MITISVKKRAAFKVSRLFFSIVESKGKVLLPLCDVVTPPRQMAGGKIIWRAHLTRLEIKFAIPKSKR